MRNRYISTIYKDIVENKTIKQIHKDIQTISKVFGVKYDLKMPKMEKFCQKVAKRVKKEIDLLVIPIGADERAERCLKEFDKMNVYKRTRKPIFDYLKELEKLGKDRAIDDEITENRKAVYPRVFYLASSHDDSAQDHVNYQGKMYIDANWKNVITDKALQGRIAYYVATNNIQTIQWVMGKPVWFITRPNCRHYFKALDTFDVFAHSVNQLTRNHKMHTKIGKDEFKPIPHPINKKWYKLANVKSIIDAYEQRLQYHQALYKQHPTQTLKKLIDKDKMLLDKWNEYLQKLQK